MPLIVAIRPFESLRHAEWLANEVPGLRVPTTLIERMQQAERDGRAADEGVAIAREIAQAVRGQASGLLVTPAAGQPEIALQVVDALAPSGARA